MLKEDKEKISNCNITVIKTQIYIFYDVVLKPVLEPTPVDQGSLKLTDIHLPLPPECWD